MKRPGVVISCDGNRATVVMKHSYACSDQHADCPWNTLLGNVVSTEFHIQAKNSIGTKPGQTVAVELPCHITHLKCFLCLLFALIDDVRRIRYCLFPFTVCRSSLPS